MPCLTFRRLSISQCHLIMNKLPTWCNWIFICFEFLQLDMFRAYTPIFRSNRCYNSYKCSICCPWFLPGKVSVLRSMCAVGVLHCNTPTAHTLLLQHANSTHTPQDRHLTRQKPRTTYATFVRTVTPIAPEDGRVSPKHVELKELKANKYSIASSWSFIS